MDTKKIEEIMGNKILESLGADRRSAPGEWEEERILNWAEVLAEEACMPRVEIADIMLGEKNAVYFILCPEVNRIKIGRTSQLLRRCRALCCASPSPLRLVHVELDADGDLEKAYHERFRKYQHHGEWFEFSGEIRDHINQKRGRNPHPLIELGII